MATRSLNGTATNSDSTQTSNQRNAFSGSTSSKLGASRTNMSNLFDFDPVTGRGSGDDIMNRAEAVLALNYGIAPEPGSGIFPADGVETGINPDFPAGWDGLNYKYTNGIGTSKFRQTMLQADLPNIFGPNLIPPSIEDPTSPTSGRAVSPTANQTNANADFTASGVSQEPKGYGTYIDTNDPRDIDQKVTKPFFMERPSDTQRQVLGEFFRTTTYDYEL
jgi:hypothetical protein